MPKTSARRATSRPIRPKPTSPSRRAGEVAAEQLRARPVVLPAAVADPPVGRDDVPARREDQREREVGDGGVEDARRVRDGDAALAARLDVDEVVADAVVRDEAEVGEELELVRADAGDGRRRGRRRPAAAPPAATPRAARPRARPRPARETLCVAAILTPSVSPPCVGLPLVVDDRDPVRRRRRARRACTSRADVRGALARCSRTSSRRAPVGHARRDADEDAVGRERTEVVADPGGGQGAAVAAALAGVEGPVVVVNADVPCVVPADVRLLAETAPALVAAADGTTNALSLPSADLFEPLYGPGSAERFHAQRAARSSMAIPNLADDVDTMDDLVRLQLRVGPRTLAALAELATERRVNVVVLSGGVGGARFVRGVVAVAGAASTTVIGNVGDDVEVLGLHVSPDLDSILYALAGLADERARLGTRRRDVARARDGARARRGGLVRARRPRPRPPPRAHAGAARGRAALGRHGAARARRSASRRASCRRPTTGCAPGSTRRPGRSRSRSGSSRAGTATRSTRSASRAPRPRGRRRERSRRSPRRI